MVISDEREKTISILLENRLVANNPDIAEFIYNNSSVQTFHKNYEVIKQGDQNNDDVYFIISGEVGVFSGTRQLRPRSAPDSVGEMAAKKPFRSRNASVVVKSEKLETRVISGTIFREICEKYEDFDKNYNDLIDEVADSNTRESGDKLENGEEESGVNGNGPIWWKNPAIMIPLGILIIAILSLILELLGVLNLY